MLVCFSPGKESHLSPEEEGGSSLMFCLALAVSW